MFEASLKPLYTSVALLAGMATTAFTAHAQATPAATMPAVVVATKDVVNTVRTDDVQLSFTYDVGDANLTSTSPFSFLLVGGSAEVAAPLYQGLGFAGSFTGVYSQNSGQGVPVNLLIFTFGPRYTVKATHGKHMVQVYGQSLIGEANGFKGLYPSPGGALTSANSLALQNGGGIDIDYTPHVSIRVLQADWLRTYLPDSRQNIENTMRLGIGIVFHSARH